MGNSSAGLGQKRQDGDIHIDTSHTFHSQIGRFCVVTKNLRVAEATTLNREGEKITAFTGDKVKQRWRTVPASVPEE